MERKGNRGATVDRRDRRSIGWISGEKLEIGDRVWPVPGRKPVAG